MKIKSVLKAIASSIIWGLGQLFNKQFIKSLFFFFFFALMITVELATSRYFDDPKSNDEIALSKIQGDSLGSWYYTWFFQVYDVEIQQNRAIPEFDAYLADLGVQKVNGRYSVSSNTTAKLFNEERFIEYFANDIKKASQLRYTNLITNEEIAYEEFDLANATFLITKRDLLYDEDNHIFYFENTTTDAGGNAKKEYVETNLFTLMDNPSIRNNKDGLITFNKTGELYKESDNLYVRVTVNGENRFLRLTLDDFDLREQTSGFTPLRLSQVNGPIVLSDNIVYEYYEPGLIFNGYRQQYKQTEFSNLFRKAMQLYYNRDILQDPIAIEDYQKLMIRVYLELNPTLKEAYMENFNNFFYDRAGMFIRGFWEIITLGQSGDVRFTQHQALREAMIGKPTGEPTATNVAPFLGSGTIYEEVIVRGHVSTLLLLDGLISTILFLFFIIFGIWSAIDAYKTSEELRLEGTTKNTKTYFKSVWDNGFEYIILSPALFVLAFITIMPIIFGFVISFTSIRGTLSMTALFDWVGFQNFISIFDPNSSIGSGFSIAFWRVLGWTVVWAIFSTLTVFFGGFFQALILNSESVVFRKVWRTILILPWAIPALLSQMIFSVIFNEYGLVNQLLQNMGAYDLFRSWGILGIPFNEASGIARYFWLGHDNILWFKNFHNPNFVRMTLIVINIWLGFPYFMALMTGIMTAIDKSLYEAADIDGASGFQKLTKITMPLVLYSTAPILIMTFSGNFNNFGVIYFITGGGPGDLTDPLRGFAGETDILISWMYRLTTDHQIYNLASVFSVLIFLLVGSITAWNLSKTKAFQED